MIPSDHDLATICLSSETDATGFDFIDHGADSGVWFGIVRHPDHDIVCFRGSITEEDWWRDLHTEMVSMPDIGLVHSGFSMNMLMVAARLKPLIRTQPVITGHSLGAARAAIYAGMIGNASKVTIFGCPRPGAQQLVDRLRGTMVTSYKNRRDPITDVPLPLPELPYCHARDFTLVDGLVDHSLGIFFEDHHVINYCKGIENAINT